MGLSHDRVLENIETAYEDIQHERANVGLGGSFRNHKDAMIHIHSEYYAMVKSIHDDRLADATKSAIRLSAVAYKYALDMGLPEHVRAEVEVDETNPFASLNHENDDDYDDELAKH